MSGLAQARHLRGDYRKAESFAKEALTLLEQVPKDKLTFAHVVEMDQCSFLAAKIAQQLGRINEAETLLQHALNRHNHGRKSRGSCYLHTAWQLIRLHTEKGNYAQAEALAKESIEIAAHGLFPTRVEPELDDRVRNTRFLFSALADLYEAMGRREEALKLSEDVVEMHLPSPGPALRPYVECIDSFRRIAEDLILQGDYQEAENLVASTPNTYKKMVEAGKLIGSYEQAKVLLRGMRVLALAYDGMGRVADAKVLRCEVEETEAIMVGLQQSALEEVREEMKRQKEEAAAAAAAAGGGGGASTSSTSTKKKVTRKQKKRRAAAAAKRRAEQGKEAEEGGAEANVDQEGNDEEEGVVEHWMASLTLMGKEKGEEQQQGGNEEEEEPQECSVCLNDIEREGEGGRKVVQLVCTHLFHAECLSLWEKKTEEVSIAFTCPMCRAAIVVAGADDDVA